MKEFDYVIIGGGCAGLSLAYELEIQEKLKDKTLAIIEPRQEYKRDKTWSFWKVTPHNFDDCVKKSWENFSINVPSETNHLECKDYPYQSIDSGLFYEKINNRLKENSNISFFKSIEEINTKNSFIFNSVPIIKKNYLNLWQHFCGVEIETKNNFFDEEIFNPEEFQAVRRTFINATKNMYRLLNENGNFLFHLIGVVDKPSAPNQFINKYIFPGGVCPSLSQLIKPIEKTGLIVADTETLIRHYDKTLEAWLERFLAKRNEIKDLFDEKFCKMWEFYLASCAAAFRYRDLVVFQLQIVKNFHSAHRTRDYIYS